MSQINIFENGECVYEEKTPLYLAVENEPYNVIYTLLQDKRIDVNILNDIYRDKNGNLQYSKDINYDDFDFIDKYKKTVLHIAVQNNEIEIVRFLLSNFDVDINIPCEKICLKYRKDNPGPGERVFRNFSEDPEKKTALHMAIDNNNTEMVKLLLSNPKIDVNCIDNYDGENVTALQKAICKNNTEMVQLLLSNPNINVNFFGPNGKKETALHSAVSIRNVKMVELLLSNPNIDINAIKSYRMETKTALHMAIENGDNEIAKLLLSNPKIDVNILETSFNNNNNHFGLYACKQQFKTALHIAYQTKNYEIIQLLLQRKDINVNAVDENGYIPSYYSNH